MGIKQTDILSFLEPESKGFLYDTARSFLKRHSNPESLFLQLKNLLSVGQLETCEDMIQLVLREGHELGDSSSLYLLRAQVAYEKGEPLPEVIAWVQQAKMCRDGNPELNTWDQWVSAKIALNEGDESKALIAMQKLVDSSEVGFMAQYEWAHSLFWKNINVDRSIELLEQMTYERPGFIKAWSTLAFAYNKVGNKLKAQEAFGQCIVLDSDPERIKIYKQQIAS